MTAASPATIVPRPLRALAKSWDVAVSYVDNDGRRRRASTDALVGVLQALGAPIDKLADAPDALRARLDARAASMVEPVTVAWGARAPVVAVRSSPASPDAGRAVQFSIDLDDGTSLTIDGADCSVETVPCPPDDGPGPAPVTRYTFPSALPEGAHALTVEQGGRHATATLLCAPRRARPFGTARAWGVFAPVYALRTTPADPLPGDFADLDSLARWAAGPGARVVGTLPVLAAFLDEPFEPSPYAPVSRRFWNEVYVDTTRLPGVAGGASGAVEATGGPGNGNGNGGDGDGDGLVDLRAAFVRTRAALERDAARVDPAAMRAFLARRPDTERYARFRAAVERHGHDWSRWPPAWRVHGIPDDALDPDRVRYHRYAQYAADTQLGELATGLRSRGQALYLDFPLGTHRDGYDVWDEGDLFVRDVNVGAPPDAFFAGGQNWGFPPLHPEVSRADGHAHFAACVEHHLEHAGLLRIDHVMGLHRLWWVPPDHEPTDGTYVHYPADELYARLTLASARHDAALIGENLGTVPPAVNRSLRRHGLGGMHVVQFELDPDAPGGVRPPAPRSVTALDTHDTATFAGFWARAARSTRDGLVTALARTGLLPSRVGEPDAGEVMTGLLELLGRSDAAIVLVTLEDLWLEAHAQNTPGTVAAENWRRPAAHAIDELTALPGLVDTLRRLDAARGGS